jgi:hypothetical protein
MPRPARFSEPIVYFLTKIKVRLAEYLIDEVMRSFCGKIGMLVGTRRGGSID